MTRNMTKNMNSDELRMLVREAIAEAMGSTDDDRTVAVTITNDADLMAFAREIAGKPEAVKSGEITYRLALSETKPAAGGGFRLESGVLNEIKVIEIAKRHSRVLLGRGAVVTPLARDKARQVKLELVKERT